MYSPYCLTQVNCLLLFHCLGSLQWGRRGFSLIYIYIYIYMHSVRCHSAFSSCVSWLCRASFFHSNFSSTLPAARLAARSVARSCLSCVSIAHGFFLLLLLLDRKWRFSRNVFLFFLNKKEGGEPVRGGDSRAVEQAERGAEFNLTAVKIFLKWRETQGGFFFFWPVRGV